MSNVANKRNMSGAIPKKKGESSSNRISKKSQFYTLRRYYQSFKKKVRYHGSKIMGLRI